MITWLALLLLTAPASEPTPQPASQPLRFGRPWAIVKAMGEIPYGIGVGAEVFPHETWSVGADVNFSPIGTFYRISTHYWPFLQRTGYRHNQFLLGAGGDLSATFGPFTAGGAITVLPLSIDLRYLVRPVEVFGFVIGTRAAIGFATQLDSPVRFAFSFVTYAGLSFGAHSSHY